MAVVHQQRYWTEEQLEAMKPGSAKAQAEMAADPEFSRMVRERVAEITNRSPR